MISKGNRYTDNNSVLWECTDVFTSGGKYYVTWAQVNDSSQFYKETYDKDWNPV